MKRETGYYWVKFKGEWLIFLYIKHMWFGISHAFYQDDSFDQIDERRILSPDETTKP